MDGMNENMNQQYNNNQYGMQGNVNLSKDQGYNMQGNNYNNMNMNQQYNNNMNMQPNMQSNMQPNINTQPTPGFAMYLILSILEFFCCNQITAAISLVLTILANSAFQSGNYVDYQSKLKGAKISLIIGLILGIVILILYFILVVLLGVIGVASTI